jgi:hypothetical protein
LCQDRLSRCKFFLFPETLNVLLLLLGHGAAFNASTHAKRNFPRQELGEARAIGKNDKDTVRPVAEEIDLAPSSAKPEQWVRHKNRCEKAMALHSMQAHMQK